MWDGWQVENWVLGIERLASIAITHPHAAYTAFTHGLAASWNYVSHTILSIGDLLDPVEKAIHHFARTYWQERSKRPG